MALNMAHFVAGVPTDNDRIFCTARSVNNTCYFYNSSNVVRSVAKASCDAMKGWLVAYNSAEEQLEVENYFTGEKRILTQHSVLTGWCDDAECCLLCREASSRRLWHPCL